MSKMKNTATPHADTTAACTTSRRQALSLMLGTFPFLSAAQAAEIADPPLRFALSQSLVANVNLNDAKAALLVWMKRISEEMNLPIEHHPNVFESTQQILKRVRDGQVDAIALNTIEYRVVAGLLDASELVVSADEKLSQYVLLVKKDAGIQTLSDLRGRRLILLNSPQMCLASPWLSKLLFDNHLDHAEQFLGALIAEQKPSRVVLPVFFGRAEACLTTLRTFNTMSELNPQLSKELIALASSPSLVATFHIFHKDYKGPYREKLIMALSRIRDSPSGQQLMTLFQFDNLVVRNADCLTSALALLEVSDRAGGKPGVVNRKG